MSAAQQVTICLQQHLNSPVSTVTRSLPRNGTNTAMKSSLKISRPNLVRCNTEPTRKSVHFSTNNLEDIRPFLKTQSPASVSLKEKLDVVWDIDDSSDDQSDIEEERPRSSKLSKKPHVIEKNWTLLTPGFTPYAMGRISPASRPMVYLDTVQLTPDGKALKVVTYVRNICFRKCVALRYTINSWESFDETAGTWSADIRKYDRDGGFDRFDILIPLTKFSEQMLNTRCIQACVRYVADDTEYWDNKDGKNYEFYLRNPRLSSQSVISTATNAMKPSPKNNDRPKSLSAPRPRALSTGFIDIHDYYNEESENFDELSTPDYLKRVGIRMRQPGSPKKDSALFDRYSFAASYNAAPINSSYQDKNEPAIDPTKAEKHQETPVFDSPVEKVKILAFGPIPTDQTTDTKAEPSTRRPRVAQPTLNKTGKVAPTKIDTAISSIMTEPPSVVSIPADSLLSDPRDMSPADLWESDSYKEFVSRYCFFTPNALEKAIPSTDHEQKHYTGGSLDQRHSVSDPNDSTNSLSSLFNTPKVLPNRI